MEPTTLLPIIAVLSLVSVEYGSWALLARASVGERWKRIDRAFHRGEELPPVSLYKVGGLYFVLDGHHRVSVARYHGVEWIDAYVTEFVAAAAGVGGGVRDPTRDRRESA